MFRRLVVFFLCLLCLWSEKCPWSCRIQRVYSPKNPRPIKEPDSSVSTSASPSCRSWLQHFGSQSWPWLGPDHISSLFPISDQNDPLPVCCLIPRATTASLQSGMIRDEWTRAECFGRNGKKSTSSWSFREMPLTGPFSIRFMRWVAKPAILFLSFLVGTEPTLLRIFLL